MKGFDCLAAMKALGEENRLRIMGRLLHGPSNVNDLSAALDLSAYNTSKHLRILREAGLVTLQKQAQQRVYEVAPEFAVHLKENHNILNLGCCQFDFSQLAT